MNEVRKPAWLKVKLPGGEGYRRVDTIVKNNNLHTICSSGLCPNISECWGNGVATFMILGDICTRSCKFCATTTGKPLPPNHREPEMVAQSIHLMGLSYCVITSVDRDDLPDHGAAHWRDTVNAIRRVNPDTTIEVLIPDFDGRSDLIDIFLESSPNVVGHNLETIERLTPQVRTKAKYRKSLETLRYIAGKGFTTKSGIMLGLGETFDEVVQTLDDLAAVGCRMVTIGQYLQPRPNNLPVQRYVTPGEFEEYGRIARQKGFIFAESGPMVRSSYHADKAQKLFETRVDNV